MPSTYTPALRVTKPATGENSGTWGDLVNDQITTLFEQAIAGYQSIALTDTDLVLTTANGAADQARSAILNFTGTLTALRTITIPNVNKTYVVRNATSGGFAISVKTASSAGFTILNGKTAFIYCDGANNIRNGVDYFSSLTAGSVTFPASGGLWAGTTSSTYYGEYRFDGAFFNGLLISDTNSGGTPTLFNILKNGASVFSVSSLGNVSGRTVGASLSTGGPMFAASNANNADGWLGISDAAATAANRYTEIGSNIANKFRIRMAGINVFNISETGVLSDLAGLELGWKTIPKNTGSLASGQCFSTTGSFTLSTANLSAGLTYNVYNDSGSQITITQGSGVTLRMAGTSLTGSRSLAPRGLATIWCNSTSEAVISGAGVT